MTDVCQHVRPQVGKAKKSVRPSIDPIKEEEEAFYKGLLITDRPVETWPLEVSETTDKPQLTVTVAVEVLHTLLA